MKISITKLSTSLAAAALAASMALPASAMTLGIGMRAEANASTTTGSISLSVRQNADAQINARVAALTKLKARVDAMQKISAEEKASLDSEITASINDMTSLKAKIDADTDLATFQADVKSITKGFRIYLLIMPRAAIISASDREMDIASQLMAVSSRLQAKISAAETSGKDVTSLNASLSDMNSKLADANTQAQAAINEVANLEVDNGDKTVFQNNLQAIKDARSKIRAAMVDLKTARADAGNIVKALNSWNVSTSASAAASSTPDAGKDSDMGNQNH